MAFAVNINQNSIAAAPGPHQHQLPPSHCVGRESRQDDDPWPQAEKPPSGPGSGYLLPPSGPGSGYLLPQRLPSGASYERLPQRLTPHPTTSEWPPVSGRSTFGGEVNSASPTAVVSSRGRAASEDALYAHTLGDAQAITIADRGIVRDSSALRNRRGTADPVVVMRDNSRCWAGAEFGNHIGNPQQTPPLYPPTPNSSKPGVMPVFASAPVVYHDAAQQCEPCNLERRIQQLQQLNEELEHRLDEDGLKFLEAIASYENEVDVLSRQNREIVEERAKTEGLLARQTGKHDIERERQDMLNQMDLFEQEKDEEIRIIQETADRLSRQLEDQQRLFQRRISQAERDRDATLQAMTDEGEELHARIDKLSKDKEELRLDLAKALARVDVANTLNSTIDTSRGGVNGSMAYSRTEASNQLRSVVGEREALKDDVTTKEGQILLLRNQLEIATRKLRLADMENAILKNEIEVSRRGSPAHGGSAVVPTPELAQRGTGTKLALETTNGHH